MQESSAIATERRDKPAPALSNAAVGRARVAKSSSYATICPGWVLIAWTATANEPGVCFSIDLSDRTARYHPFPYVATGDCTATISESADPLCWELALPFTWSGRKHSGPSEMNSLAIPSPDIIRMEASNTPSAGQSMVVCMQLWAGIADCWPKDAEASRIAIITPLQGRSRFLRAIMQLVRVKVQEVRRTRLVSSRAPIGLRVIRFEFAISDGIRRPMIMIPDFYPRLQPQVTCCGLWLNLAQGRQFPRIDSESIWNFGISHW